MKIRAVLFDLDGTLADTAPDLGEALNILRRRNNLPDMPMDAIRAVAGNGAAGLLRLGFGILPTRHDFAQWQQEFLDAYASCLAQNTRLFPGMENVLRQLTQDGFLWGIVTNKHSRFTLPLLETLNLPSQPAVVVCGDTVGALKPSPEPMLFAAAQLDTAPQNCLYIGDAERDMMAAQEAGMYTIMANWGYIEENEPIELWPFDTQVERPSEILEHLAVYSDMQKADGTASDDDALRPLNFPRPMMTAAQPLRIALFPADSLAGDFAANAENIAAAAYAARDAGAKLLLLPEMALSGYPLGSLVHRPLFAAHAEHALARLREIHGITLVLTHPVQNTDGVFGAVSVLRNGELLAHSVRNAGKNVLTFFSDDTAFALIIGADIDDFTIQEALAQTSADVVLHAGLAAFHATRLTETLAHYRTLAARIRTPILAVNASGSREHWVFDGMTAGIDAGGNTVFCTAGFKAENVWVDFHPESKTFSGDALAATAHLLSEPAESLLYRAICAGLEGYMKDNGFEKVCLGLSGGLDSALVLAAAVDTCGAENCEVLLMPGDFTAEISNTAAAKMAENLGVAYHVMPIPPLFAAFKNTLAERFAGLPEDLTEENLQARIRGTLLMALSNKTGALLLATGNKSEGAVGYATLYGDMNGGYAPLKDLLKTQAYAICRWLNAAHGEEIVPEEIIERAPSAELRAGQTDQDSLPDYAVLDGILKLFLEENQTVQEITAQGYAENEVRRIIKMVRRAEYKRRQSAPGPRLSKSAFGVDCQQPLSQNYLYD